jgi:hypothetical protein
MSPIAVRAETAPYRLTGLPESVGPSSARSARWPARLQYGPPRPLSFGAFGLGGQVVLGAQPQTHVGRILAKLDLRDRAWAVVLAFETGLVTPPANQARRERPRHQARTVTGSHHAVGTRAGPAAQRVPPMRAASQMCCQCV